MEKKIFDPFDINEDKEYIPWVDLDLDKCYFNDVSYSVQSNCSYCSEDSLNDFFCENFKSCILAHFFHMNMRGIKFIKFLSNLDTGFDISVITETWWY